MTSLSTEPESDSGLPEVDTLGLVLGLERLELSTRDGSILYLPIAPSKMGFLSGSIYKNRQLIQITEEKLYTERGSQQVNKVINIKVIVSCEFKLTNLHEEKLIVK